MKRRCARAALVACLILFVVAGSCRGRKHSGRRHHAGRRLPLPAHGLAYADVAAILRHGLGGGGYRTPAAEKSESLVDDDKRLVPTGSNPLHNRFEKRLNKLNDLGKM
ncbi:hypothetical protein ZIOFF_073909 [Zingiber officinale]|uniref:Uncharacterized protein n=1 Tax=Zingiber officinale TaxID=94328 RepID=A0A8J5CTQ3_ZINOF|nr:hypothetical protein ZIOFF_073909 [Zingiber officinale]